MYKGIDHHKNKKRLKKYSGKIIKYLYLISFYAASIYVLEYQFLLPIFVKISILYGVTIALKHISK